MEHGDRRQWLLILHHILLTFEGEKKSQTKKFNIN